MNIDSSSGASPQTTTWLDASREPASSAAVSPAPPRPTDDIAGVFVPLEPNSLEEAGLSETDVEALILKYLNSYGHQLGRRIAQHVKLPFLIVQEILNGLKTQMFVNYKTVATAGDYVYELTELGHRRARLYAEICSYCGAAPVGFERYVDSVAAQSLRRHRLTPNDVKQAFRNLVLPPQILAQIGQAVHAGRCLFLYGESGNGKTSVATQCLDAYDSGIWIPRTITIGGEIIRLYDPSLHEAIPHPREESLLKKSQVDERWIRIRRPKVIVGGELSFSELEITQNRFTGVLEAPIHMKSNNGCLVIDDFGRQQVTMTELLNRWIIPLENGKDYMRMPNGRKIETPFDQLLVFSTNLEPIALGEEAFFRRIPYKLEMPGPTHAQFTRLFEIKAQQAGFQYPPDAAEYLISALLNRRGSLKFCYAGDILSQCEEFCEFTGRERRLSPELIDLAIHNYFAGL